MSKFTKCLTQGQKYELKALDYFNYKTFKQSQGKFKDYDLILDDNIKVEVKAEKNAFRYGNLAIETSNYNSPSGISYTKADYWIHFVIHPTDEKKDICLKFPINDLKELIKGCRNVRGGDNMASYMFLLPINKCLKYKVNKIDKVEYFDIKKKNGKMNIREFFKNTN
jgi:hypothetical protein